MCCVLPSAIARVVDEVSKVVVGKEGAIRAVASAILSGGHVLLEGLPGLGKTLMARSFAMAMGGIFRRVQMTPDLLPSDITGSMIYDQSGGDFIFREGPVFSNVLMVDELNRATPRTQAALLEAMQERQVTVEGVPRRLPEPFIVIATQVPFGMPGTYPLPEVQIDRFALMVFVDLPNRGEEAEILDRIDEIEGMPISKVSSPDEIAEEAVEVRGSVEVSERVRDYILDLVGSVRGVDGLLIPPSPRASIWLMKVSRAMAYLEGRDYVIPDDVKGAARYVLPHRVILKPEVEAEGMRPEDVVSRTLERVEVPKEA